MTDWLFFVRQFSLTIILGLLIGWLILRMHGNAVIRKMQKDADRARYCKHDRFKDRCKTCIEAYFAEEEEEEEEEEEDTVEIDARVITDATPETASNGMWVCMYGGYHPVGQMCGCQCSSGTGAGTMIHGSFTCGFGGVHPFGTGCNCNSQVWTSWCSNTSGASSNTTNSTITVTSGYLQTGENNAQIVQ